MSNAQYTPEQLALHQRIVNASLEGKHRAEHPEFVVLCGAAKSGKALYYKKHFAPDDSVVCIRTRLFKNLPYFKEYSQLAHPEKLPAYVDEYYDICAAICEEAHARGLSVHWLDHGDAPEQIRRMTDIFGDYKTTLLGFYVPPMMQSAINIFSHVSGGKYIEAGRSRRMQHDFAAGWTAYEPLFNQSFLYTVGVRDMQARIPETLICHKSDDGVQHVFHPNSLRMFQSLAQPSAMNRSKTFP